MKGIQRGMDNKRGDVRADLKGIVKELVKEAMDELKEKSPSRVFMEIGANTMRGLSIGIDGTVGEAVRSMQGAIRSVIPDASDLRMPDADAAAASRNPGGLTINQNVYANQTSYAQQQRQAAKAFAWAARGVL